MESKESVVRGSGAGEVIAIIARHSAHARTLRPSLLSSYRFAAQSEMSLDMESWCEAVFLAALQLHSLNGPTLWSWQSPPEQVVSAGRRIAAALPQPLEVHATRDAVSASLDTFESHIKLCFTIHSLHAIYCRVRKVVASAQLADAQPPRPSAHSQSSSPPCLPASIQPSQHDSSTS